MEKSLLEKYDEIFFNKQRIGELIDEIHLSESRSTDLKALEAILCSYIRDRVTCHSSLNPMSMLLIIKVENINLGESERDIFLHRIKYITKKLNLGAISQEADGKIYINLY